VFAMQLRRVNRTIKTRQRCNGMMNKTRIRITSRKKKRRINKMCPLNVSPASGFM